MKYGIEKKDINKIELLQGFKNDKDYNKYINIFDNTIGSIRKITSEEKYMGEPKRIMLYKVKKGEILTRENLVCLRPNHGIDARDYYKVLGKKLNQDVIMHQKLDWTMVI